jgi:hypothetical protein
VLFDDHLKTESRVPKGLTPSPKGTHTDGPKPGQKPAKRVPKGLIDSAPGMSPKGIHNCLPPPLTLMPWSTPCLTEVSSTAGSLGNRVLS